MPSRSDCPGALQPQGSHHLPFNGKRRHDVRQLQEDGSVRPPASRNAMDQYRTLTACLCSMISHD